MQQPLISAARPSEVFSQAPHPHELAAAQQMAGSMSQGQQYTSGPAIAPTVVPKSFAGYQAPETPPTYQQGLQNEASNPLHATQRLHARRR